MIIEKIPVKLPLKPIITILNCPVSEFGPDSYRDWSLNT